MLNEKQKLEQKQMLIEMQKEIQQLELEIKHLKTENFKMNLLKRLNISICTARLIAPYLLIAEIMALLFSSVGGGHPFIRDNMKQRLSQRKEIDSFGNISYEEQYQEFGNTQGTISYFGNWIPKDDGFFSREVKTYKITEISEDIVEIIVNNTDAISLEKVFGEPISSSIQTKNNLTEDELEKPEFLQAVIYSQIDDNFIVVKEPIEFNSAVTALYILTTLMAFTLPTYIFPFDY